MEYCYIYILVQLCILVKSIKINESLVPLYFASQACASKKNVINHLKFYFLVKSEIVTMNLIVK